MPDRDALLTRRIVAAREARERWIKTIHENRGHAYIRLQWQAYVDLANLAGPTVLGALETEAAQADYLLHQVANATGGEIVEPPHTVRGEPIGPEGVPYGTTHDRDCPACVASGQDWSLTPRSEAYWSS